MPLVTRTSVQGTVYRQSSQPSDVTSGTIWVDTSTSPPTLYIADGSTYNGAVSGTTTITVGGLSTTLANWLSI